MKTGLVAVSPAKAGENASKKRLLVKALRLEHFAKQRQVDEQVIELNESANKILREGWRRHFGVDFVDGM